MNRTPCELNDPELWHADPRTREAEHAKTLCHTCHIQAQCLTTALEREGNLVAGGRFGIWGATDPEERAEFARRQTGRRNRKP